MSDKEIFEVEEITPELFAKITYLNSKYKNGEPVLLRPYQLKLAWKIIKSVLDKDGKEFFGFQARQSGKTEVDAAICFFLMIVPSICPKYSNRNIKIGIFAPKKEQADISYRRVLEKLETGFLTDIFGITILEKNQKMIRLSNGSFVKSITASMTATIEGETFDVVIIEEAQDVSDVRIKKSIFPMLATTNGTRVLLGTSTPEKKSGYFLDSVRQKPDRVFKVDCYEAAQYSPEYSKFIKAEEQRLGKDSPEFRTQYLLEFADFSSTYISEKELSSIRSNRLKIKLECDEPCIVGIDIAKAPDSTVVTILKREPVSIINWLELQHDDYNSQFTDIIAFLRNYNREVIVIDGFGPGAVMADMLESFCSEDPDLANIDIQIIKPHVRRKSELFLSLRDAIRNKKLSYPSTRCKERHKFEKQMLALIMEFSEPVGCFKFHHPKGEHDDYVDSLAYAWFGLTAGEYTFSHELPEFIQDEHTKADILPDTEELNNSFSMPTLSMVSTSKGQKNFSDSRWKRNRRP